MKLTLTALFLCLFFAVYSQQVTLTSSPYTETFDNINGGLPNGWTVRTGATTTALGTEVNFDGTSKTWGDSPGGFKNLASADGLTATSTTTNQHSSADRSLGIRQTSTFGDPSAAFVVKLSDATDFKNLAISFKLQSLASSSPRQTTWTVDYGIGENPTSFTPITTSPSNLLTGNTTFSTQTISAMLPSIVDGLNQPIYIRIVTLSPASGTGNRASTGIDDFNLTFEPISGTGPIVLVNTTAVSGFVTSEGTPSSEKSYTIRGENLTGGILITAPAGFEVSATAGSGYSSSITLPQSAAGQVPMTPVFIRLIGTAAGTLNGNITHTSGASPQRNITVDGLVNPPLSVSTPISSVRAMADGTTVTVAGRATVGEQFGGFQIFIQDVTGGISVYRASGNLVQENNIAIGDSVQVQGVLGSFNELKQITVSQILRVNVPAVQALPKVIQSSEILAYEGQLVQVNNVSTPTATYAPQTNYPFTPVQVRITQQTNGAGFVNPIVGTSITSGMGHAIGIAGRFNASSQLLPRLTTDLVRTGDPIPGSTDGTFENPTTLDIVSWNIEWFGNTANGPSNETLQMTNAKRVIETINADIYNLNEISDISAFNMLLASLIGYSGVCSSEVSNNASDGQRVCFIYKTALFSNVSTRHLLKTIKDNPSLLPTYPDVDKSRFWASGRLPFALKADVTIPGSPTRNIMFVGVHARANTSAAESFQRYSMRKYDVEVLRDSLNAQFPNQAFVMLGDFNDDLDVTVAANIPGNATSYETYNKDPAHFNMLTRILSDAGQRSTVGFSDMIDHIIASNELNGTYISGSARVSNAEQYITSYGSTTSDHYAVMLRLNLSNLPACPPSLTLISPADNISTETIVKQASSEQGGTISARNMISGNANVRYQAAVVELNPGFIAESGTVFLAETGGCVN